MAESWTNEQIIADALGRRADVQIGARDASWRLSRWRQFVGTYELPALPDPTFVVHIAGKPRVKTRLSHGWSETSSIPGCATIVPAGRPSGWLVDGELDVVTLSIASRDLERSSARDQFAAMRFAFSDPLGVALTRQVLAELYAPQTAERKVYVATLVDALKAHMLRGPFAANDTAFPVSEFSAHRIHHVMNAVQERPAEEHSIEAMAAQVGLTPSHFCRVFKRATSLTPHQYVMKARIERAQEMLATTELSMAQIAEAMGFGSQSHFARAFRNFTGTTPTMWRGNGSG
ncbi:AraC family transcriptional regulator [Novosphingobium sp. KCTC 2891]|uniref:helix-turn-helix domain-containing protein n=1 Tax=Novosphingobium sp. KCTC 2891 TaxID=2989730 RepID=UPI002221C8CA|nr:AraC family transcriptional regulator [Novosphingobium sp. KCTC 2891]MCW1381590.1 AraC family transcriptional regulator [Novosphingobium sp. KCTC 2891]